MAQPPQQPPTTFATASCICNGIRLTISQPPDAKYLCHCLSCHKWSGSAFGANWLLPRSAITFMSKDTLTTYEDPTASSGRALTRNFCSRCGSNIFIETDYRPDSLVICSGVVDAPEGVDWKPDSEGWVDRKVAWLKNVDLGIKPMEG